MSNLKEIRRRIGSVSNTKQITRAMKLVSAAKLRRAQEAATGGRDFSKRLDRILTELMGSLPEDFTHPLLEARKEIKKRRLVVVSGDRGLCGPYNTNIQKAVVKELEASEAAGIEVDMIGIGRRAVASANSWRNGQLLKLALPVVMILKAESVTKLFCSIPIFIRP